MWRVTNCVSTLLDWSFFSCIIHPGASISTRTFSNPFEVNSLFVINSLARRSCLQLVNVCVICAGGSHLSKTISVYNAAELQEFTSNNPAYKKESVGAFAGKLWDSSTCLQTHTHTHTLFLKMNYSGTSPAEASRSINVTEPLAEEKGKRRTESLSYLSDLKIRGRKPEYKRTDFHPLHISRQLRRLTAQSSSENRHYCSCGWCRNTEMI